MKRKSKLIGATAVALVLSLSASPCAHALATNSVLYEQIDTNVDVLPPAPLTLGRNGILYGSSYSDPYEGDDGSLFCLEPASGAIVSLYQFDGTDDGALPVGGLTLYQGTNIFSTTGQGGSGSAGTLYKFTLDGTGTNGTFKVIWDFGTSGTNGTFPACPPITKDGVLLYGSTAYTGTSGGASGNGTFYCISNGGTNATMLWSIVLDGMNGREPYAPLVWGPDGNMYGTTFYGGDDDSGTVGRLTTNGAWTVLYSFTNGYDGQYPAVSLTLAPDGWFYSITDGINSLVSYVIYRLNPTNGAFETICQIPFGYSLYNTQRPLAVGPDGALYGNDQAGGDYGGGEFFRLDTSGNFTVLKSLPWSGGFGYDLTYLNGPTLGADNCFYYFSMYAESDCHRISVPMPTMATNLTAICPEGVELRFTAVAGQQYEIDMSTNLADPAGWSAISTVTATNGWASIIDTNRFGAAFYSIRQIVDSLNGTNVAGITRLPGNPQFSSGPSNDWSCFLSSAGGSGGGSETNSIGTNGPPLP